MLFICLSGVFNML